MMPVRTTHPVPSASGRRPGRTPVSGNIRLVAAWLLLLSYFYMIPVEFSALQWEKTGEGLWRITQGQSADPVFLIQYLLWMFLTFIGALMFIGAGFANGFSYERKGKEGPLTGGDLAYYFAWVQVSTVGFFIPYYAITEKDGWLSALAPYLPHAFMLGLALVLFRRCLPRLGFQVPPLRRWIGMMFAAAAGYLFVYYLLDPLVTEPVGRLFSLEMQSWREDSISGGIHQAVDLGWIYVVGQLLLIGVIGPAAEEVVFRGLLMGFLVKRLGVVASVILSSVVFALFHVDVVFLAPLFVMGLILGSLYVFFRNLWAPVLFHIVNNVLSVVFDLLGSS
ncbi:membrane protease YdiL (CAAX protease family) [Melghirimyces profundicolus]|uniref:Membrane protease YdiL (CAAX protease family) n=1 Tax=Melghirimyces profundicolus TaxID=1242148 RepID=A0A2T6BAJ7_9BACL|nr:type II CAAX endopeptidase family protein [Melghirimyces profundicolus]PTX53089.1 membrane protease YdiL (CAAX protease family) [Melghirimyces profundicolus]